MLQTLLFLLTLLPELLVGAVQWSSPTLHDFGTVDRGRPVSHVFTFINTGDTPLTVETARTTCGCTVPDWPRQPILPDSTGRITVTYDALKKGDFKKTVRVYFHEIRAAEKLSVLGRVE